MCACFLIVQLLATGALRPFPWGAYELRPPELGLAARLSGGEGGDSCPVWPKPTGPRGQKAIPLVHRQRDTCQPTVTACLRAGVHAGVVSCTEPSRPCQQLWGWLKLPRTLLLVSVTAVCLLLTAPAHLFSACKLLQTPFWVVWVGKGRGGMCF